MNEGIDPDLTSLQYLNIDDIATLVSEKGAGALLAKVDIKAAYRQIPVHPQDRPLQALKWEGSTQDSHSGSDQRQRFSMLWPMHWNGC